MPRIAICAPSTPITRDVAERVTALASEYPGLELHFHDQCFVSEGHFAGSDEVRLAALLDCANDPLVDVVWFAKGGYGANRIAAEAAARMDDTAHAKTWIGYSDTGFLLAALYRNRIGRPVHGPMPVDIRRSGGAAAVRRVLAWVSEDDPAGLEPGIGEGRTAAFNLSTLAALCGSNIMPDLTSHVVMVEEVAEHLYAVDRLFFHVTQNLTGIAGLRLGRISDVPENDRPFGASIEEIARYWCARADIPFLGEANIGHDAANRIVPFGLAGQSGHT